MVNELYYIRNHNYGIASIKRVVQGLIDYTANHFDYEETLFEQSGYPQDAEHKASHRKLVNQALDFQKKVNNGEDVGAELMSFLKAWLSNHITVEDAAYSHHFKEHGLK